jgi:hypothetical protein
MSAPAEAPAKKDAREKTGYRVLQQDGNNWRDVGTVAAANSDAAIRAHTAKVADDGTTLDGSGVFVAIPARSWKPVTVKTETKTVLTIT